jgi:hypothetical protein
MNFEHLFGIFVTGMLSSVALMAISYNVVVVRRRTPSSNVMDMQFSHVEGSEPFMSSEFVE